MLSASPVEIGCKVLSYEIPADQTSLAEFLSFERFLIRNRLAYKYRDRLRDEYSIEILSSSSTTDSKDEVLPGHRPPDGPLHPGHGILRTLLQVYKLDTRYSDHFKISQYTSRGLWMPQAGSLWQKIAGASITREALYQ